MKSLNKNIEFRFFKTDTERIADDERPFTITKQYHWMRLCSTKSTVVLTTAINLCLTYSMMRELIAICIKIGVDPEFPESELLKGSKNKSSKRGKKVPTRPVATETAIGYNYQKS